MMILLNNMQKKIALYSMLNKSSKIYMTNTIVDLTSNVDLEKYKQAITDTLNASILFRCIFKIIDGNFAFEEKELFTTDEIKFIKAEDNEDLYKRDIFTVPYDVQSEERLTRCELVEKNNKLYFLFSAHHIIFDIYSGITFLDSIFNLYCRNINFEKLSEKNNLEMQQYLAHEINEKQVNKAIDNYKKYDYMLEDACKVDFETGNEIFENRFYVDEELIKDISVRNQSAINIYALGRILNKKYGKNHVVIGVPVPNRNRDNKNVVSCMINMLPVFIDFTLEIEFIDVIKSINQQLFNNLRYQEYDYVESHRDKMPKGSFDFMSTYYPHTFKWQSGEFIMECEKIFMSESPSAIHIMMRDRIITIETTICDENIVAEFQDIVNESYKRFKGDNND